MDLLSSAEYLNQLIVDSLTDQVNISVSSSNASKDSFKESESIADQWIMPVS